MGWQTSPEFFLDEKKMNDVSDAFRGLHQEIGSQCRTTLGTDFYWNHIEFQLWGALWGPIERVRLKLLYMNA